VAGQASPISPCGCAPGTTIEVRNLFFNTPVRRKFMRSVSTEMGHVTEALTRLALAHPRVHFSLRHNQRSLYELPPCDDPLARIAHFFGRELADALLWLESRDGEVRLSGYVGHPSQSRPNNRLQYLFLNGRSIRDRALGHALAEAYRGLLLTGRCPVSFLSLDLPPELVDVNVHPTKLEVRFQDGGRLYSQLLGTLRTKFLTTDLTHRLDAATAEGRDPSGAHDVARAAQLRGELVDWAKGQMADWQTPAGAATDQAAPAHQTRFEVPLPPAAAPLQLTPLVGAAAGANGGHTGNGSNAAAHSAPAAGVSRAAGALQIHNRYLVAETADGVAVIDQHALHERILYEQLRERVLAGALEAQHLLVPEPVDLCATDAAAVLEERELLATLGVKVEPFGGDTVL
ncbi:MAG: DNA mismatch repair endonuclease MutL, partial [Candidatus Saccharimonadales bacterium]